MGDLIVLKERLADRSRAACGARATDGSRAAFFFDPGCPFSYMAIEFVERILGNVEWIPVAGVVLGGVAGARPTVIRAEAERRAETLRLPLVWPDRFPADLRPALRAAAYAAEVGAGGRFALAASRLAFCGGFDLGDPEILAEAAAAAGLALDRCLAAAREQTYDEVLVATAHGLRRRGLTRLPVVRVDRHYFNGELALTQAVAMLRAEAADGRSRERPLAPAG